MGPFTLRYNFDDDDEPDLDPNDDEDFDEDDDEETDEDEPETWQVSKRTPFL